MNAHLRFRVSSPPLPLPSQGLHQHPPPTCYVTFASCVLALRSYHNPKHVIAIVLDDALYAAAPAQLCDARQDCAHVLGVLFMLAMSRCGRDT
mmetsp:Transcript_17210/g.29748  ORF Transcript_17210/g.29748 Transcript_17210/m.29748 type:complete len:93 (+) Transcript_17210:786-1064(+)